jgi:hypothetical protein
MDAAMERCSVAVSGMADGAEDQPPRRRSSP